MLSLATDYFLLVFIATTGLLQIVAASSRLRGVLIVPKIEASYGIGAGLLIGAFTWFVLTGDPSIPGDLGGVEGAEQFGLFLGGVSAAVVATATLSSVTQWGWHSGMSEGSGVDALRQSTVVALLRARFSRRPRHD